MYPIYNDNNNEVHIGRRLFFLGIHHEGICDKRCDLDSSYDEYIKMKEINLAGCINANLLKNIDPDKITKII